MKNLNDLGRILNQATSWSIEAEFAFEMHLPEEIKKKVLCEATAYITKRMFNKLSAREALEIQSRISKYLQLDNPFEQFAQKHQNSKFLGYDNVFELCYGWVLKHITLDCVVFSDGLMVRQRKLLVLHRHIESLLKEISFYKRRKFFDQIEIINKYVVSRKYDQLREVISSLSSMIDYDLLYICDGLEGRENDQIYGYFAIIVSVFSSLKS